MRREKSPGLKILWLWTFGTAAILVTNVMRTRIRELETLMNADEQQQQEEKQQHDAIPSDSPQVIVDTLHPQSETLISEDRE